MVENSNIESDGIQQIGPFGQHRIDYGTESWHLFFASPSIALLSLGNAWLHIGVVSMREKPTKKIFTAF